VSGFTINSVTISGNHTRDPELRNLPSGTTVCKCRLAVNDRVKNKDTGEWTDKPNYFDVTVFGGLGEWLANNSGKGDGITVHGRLSWHEWDVEGGGKRSAVEIIADSIVPQRDGGGGGGGGSRQGESDVPIDTGDLLPVGTATPSAADDDIPF
jgi:single-strand DNA-binding protein